MSTPSPFGSSSSSSFSLDTMIINLNAAVGNVKLLVGAISTLAGVTLIFKGIGLYRAFGQTVTQTSQRGELAGPMVYIFVGAMLIYLPSNIDASLATIFGGSSSFSTTSDAQALMGYSTGSSFQRWSDLSGVIVNYLKLIGLIAFVRGWFILSKMGQSGTQPGMLGKGITHLIGGILLVNVVDTINILAETFGFS